MSQAQLQKENQPLPTTITLLLLRQATSTILQQCTQALPWNKAPVQNPSEARGGVWYGFAPFQSKFGPDLRYFLQHFGRESLESLIPMRVTERCGLRSDHGVRSLQVRWGHQTVAHSSPTLACIPQYLLVWTIARP